MAFGKMGGSGNPIKGVNPPAVPKIPMGIAMAGGPPKPPRAPKPQGPPMARVGAPKMGSRKFGR